MRLNKNNTFIGINPPYQLSVIHSSKLIYPREIYQRGVEMCIRDSSEAEQTCAINSASLFNA